MITFYHGIGNSGSKPRCCLGLLSLTASPCCWAYRYPWELRSRDGPQQPPSAGHSRCASPTWAEHLAAWTRRGRHLYLTGVLSTGVLSTGVKDAWQLLLACVFWGLSVVMEVVQLPAGETTQAGAWGGEALRWPAAPGVWPRFPRCQREPPAGSSVPLTAAS